MCIFSLNYCQTHYIKPYYYFKMMRKALLIAKMILLVFISRGTFAQTVDSISTSLQRQFKYYSIEKASTLMFVHLDKTVYVNNDMIWFTAYLLNCTKADLNNHKVLSALLVKDDDQSIAVQDKFRINLGIGSGSLTIPDTIPPGNYTFIAYTNKMVNGKPDAFFKQSVTLKTGAQANFEVEMTIDTAHQTPTMLPVSIHAYNKISPVILAPITYTLGADRHTRFTGKAKTDITGRYELMVPKTSINAAQHTLEVQVKNNKDIKTLHLTMPILHQVNNVKFYPEGGHLVAGLINSVGWETKSATGVAIKTQGVLYAGKEPIDTIETDSFGMGEFYFLPIPNILYTVKLLQNSTDSVYSLPAPLTTHTVQIHLPDALGEDTLKLRMNSNYTGKVWFLVHNYRQLFILNSLKASVNGSLLKIDLSEVPRGLNTITILDSLQRPLTERMFFAHYNQKPAISIIAGQKEVGTRQKVSIKLSLAAGGKSAIGIVSVACVQDNRFEIKKENNIEHYVYLQNEIDQLPLKDNLMGNAAIDKKYLNELLLVRGWSKYKWQDLEQVNPADTVRIQDSLKFTGIVTRLGSKIEKPLTIINMGNNLLGDLVLTEPNGAFKLNTAQLYRPIGKKVGLIISGESDKYIIKTDDPYKSVNKVLAQNIEPAPYPEPLIQNTGEFVLKGFEHVTNLKEVKIIGHNDRLRYGVGANACGDYVCSFNILNCPHHGPFAMGNHPPIKGEMVRLPNTNLVVAYEGCGIDYIKPGMISFPGIYAAKEFYGVDYSQTNSNTDEPDYSSTIYWKNTMAISTSKPAELSFYTSDITGKFRIVVQGIAGNDVVYGEDSFMVTKK